MSWWDDEDRDWMKAHRAIYSEPAPTEPGFVPDEIHDVCYPPERRAIDDLLSEVTAAQDWHIKRQVLPKFDPTDPHRGH